VKIEKNILVFHEIKMRGWRRRKTCFFNLNICVLRSLKVLKLQILVPTLNLKDKIKKEGVDGENKKDFS
jgi:hypothetical protein